MRKGIDYHFMREITALRNVSHPGFIYSHLHFFPPFFIHIYIGRGTKVASTRIGYGYISKHLAILRQTHAERSCKFCKWDLTGRKAETAWLIPVSVLCEKSAWLITCQFYVRNPSPHEARKYFIPKSNA